MVECVETDSIGGFRITARPNSAAGGPGFGVALSVLLPACFTAGLLFLALGAWPVALFMTLPLLALAGAFGRIRRHAGDFERLVLSRDRLILDFHSAAGDEHQEFNSQWVQLGQRRSLVGEVLTLRCHGQEAVFGRLLTGEERRRVDRELRRRLAQLRH